MADPTWTYGESPLDRNNPNQVRAFQQYLKEQGSYDGDIDGAIQSQSLTKAANNYDKLIQALMKARPSGMDEVKVGEAKLGLKEKERQALEAARQREIERRKRIEQEVIGDEFSLGRWGLPAAALGGLLTGVGGAGVIHAIKSRASKRKARVVDQIGAAERDHVDFGQDPIATTVGVRGGAPTAAASVMGKESVLDNPDAGPWLKEPDTWKDKLADAAPILGVDAALSTASGAKAAFLASERDEALRKYTEEIEKGGVNADIYYRRFLELDGDYKTAMAFAIGLGTAGAGYGAAATKLPRPTVASELQNGANLSAIEGVRRGVQRFEALNPIAPPAPASNPGALARLRSLFGATGQPPRRGEPIAPPRQAGMQGRQGVAGGQGQRGQAQLPPGARNYTDKDSQATRDMLADAVRQGQDPRAISVPRIQQNLQKVRGGNPVDTAQIAGRKTAMDDYLTTELEAKGKAITPTAVKKAKRSYKGNRTLGLTGAAAGGAAAAAALTPSQSEALESRVSGLMVSGKRIEDITARDVQGFVSDAEPAAIEAALMDMRGRAGERTNGRTQADQLRAIKDRSSPTGFRSPDGRFASPQ